MANERTEAATPKRRKEVRSRGQVPKSNDLTSGIMLTVGLVLIYIYTPSMVIKFKAVAIEVFSHLDPNKISLENFTGFFSPYVYLMFDILTPILLILMICGILLNLLIVGPLFTLEPLKPSLDKFGPSGMVASFKKLLLFDMKNIVELIKAFIKMIVVAWIAYSVIISNKEHILTLRYDLSQSLTVISSIIFSMAAKICIFLIFLGILDKKYQEYEYEKSIKMTKEEIKDERKNSEGDPQVKTKIKSIQMQFAMQRMMGSIPKADVVITNPTHYAIAIRYDPKIAPAPQVVAKGVDFVAFRIRDVAKHNNIPIVENKPLARTLYKVVPLEGLIPAELYVAVAEVLAFVFKANQGRSR
jgi:flagellar biosynthesis protein FlhB